MKKRTIVSLLSLPLVFFAACKKDNDKSTAEKLQGKWNLQKAVWNNYNSGDNKDSSTYAAGTNYLNFINSSQVIMHYPGGTDTLGFKVLDDQHFVLDQDTVTINLLTDTQLKSYSKETYSASTWYEEWDTFTK